MPESFVEQHPEFSQRIASILNSGYWWANEPGVDVDIHTYVKWQEATWARRQVLQDVLHKARSYDDLKGTDKELFDAVEAFNKDK